MQWVSYGLSHSLQYFIRILCLPLLRTLKSKLPIHLPLPSHWSFNGSLASLLSPNPRDRASLFYTHHLLSFLLLHSNHMWVRSCDLSLTHSCNLQLWIIFPLLYLFSARSHKWTHSAHNTQTHEFAPSKCDSLSEIPEITGYCTNCILLAPRLLFNLLVRLYERTGYRSAMHTHH